MMVWYNKFLHIKYLAYYGNIDWFLIVAFQVSVKKNKTITICAQLKRYLQT